MVQNFRDVAKNPMIKNFHDKNFVIATFFRDYHHAAASVQTIHIITPPTIARGSALGQHASVKRKETRQELYRPLFRPLAPSTVICLAISST